MNLDLGHFHTFNNELLLILDLQVFQCVVFVVQEG